jgi:hypothetical protein
MATVVIIIVDKYVIKNLIFMHADNPLNFGSWMAFAVPQVSSRGRHLKSSFLHNKMAVVLKVLVNLGFVWLVLQLYYKKESFRAFFLTLIRQKLRFKHNLQKNILKF